jgi:hypothetical protein
MNDTSKRADDEGVIEEGATDDRAWENQLTEEDMPSPEEREEAAHELTLDPI